MATAPHRMPAVFIPHGGGPCFFMDWDPPDTWTKMAAYLKCIAAVLPRKPKAVLAISAHWEEKDLTVTTNPQPALIYDYDGFPDHTYKITYPAPGAPALAARVATLLEDAQIPVLQDAERGFDHGVFIPFKLIFPEADVPIVQMSLKKGLDPQEHIAAGKALTPLLDEDVLIAGSGMSYHNLRRFMRGHDPAAAQFDNWLREAVVSPDSLARLARWQNAPAAREAHPREEHLLPLMVVAGAAGGHGKCVYHESVNGIALSGFQFE